MKVFVTGATGFTGSHTVPLLLERGIRLRCLYRPDSNRSRLPGKEIEWAPGDLSKPDKLAAAMQGCQALVNIASLGFGNAEAIVWATREAGIQRAVFVSTTAIFTQLEAGSKTVRLEAENLIRQSQLDYTILRPTMIYGSSQDRNMCRLISWLRRSPLIPIFGDGESLQQPVFVGDVAQAIVSSLLAERTKRKAYNISGAQSLTYNALIEIILSHLHRRILKLYLPPAPVTGFLTLLEKLRIPFPIKAEQVQRLNEDKAFSHEEARQDFGYQPLSFSEGIKHELIEMQLIST